MVGIQQGAGIFKKRGLRIKSKVFTVDTEIEQSGIRILSSSLLMFKVYVSQLFGNFKTLYFRFIKRNSYFCENVKLHFENHILKIRTKEKYILEQNYL